LTPTGPVVSLPTIPGGSVIPRARLGSKTLLAVALALTVGTAVAQTGGSGATGGPTRKSVSRKSQPHTARATRRCGQQIARWRGISNTVRHNARASAHAARRREGSLFTTNSIRSTWPFGPRAIDAMRESGGDRNDTELSGHEWTSQRPRARTEQLAPKRIMHRRRSRPHGARKPT